MRNRISPLILLAVFIVLAVLVSVTNQQTPPAIQTALPSPTAAGTEMPQGTLLRVFPELRVLDIQAIQLDDLTSGREITFSRDTNGQWTAPGLEGELDETAVTNIARTLVLLPYARSINILTETDFADYGLSPRPQLLFQILNTDGSGHAVAVGALTDAENTYYALVDERDEIFIIERGPVDFLKTFILSPPIRLTN